MKELISLLLVLCMVLGMSVSVFAESTTHNVATKDDLKTAIAEAVSGDTVKLTADIDYGTAQLEITSAITLDLGENTLTTRARNYGLALYNGCTVTNGKLNHAGTVAAIKVWDAKEISNLEIDVTGTSASSNTINGIVIQKDSVGVDLISNVKIHSTDGQGVSSGIETYNCGNATEPVIGAMENVTIDAKKVGMNISAPCGTATNCNIKGGESGIEIWIKGTYSASLDLVNCTVSGGTQDVYAHDEINNNPNIVNIGTIKLTADKETTFVHNTIEDKTTRVNKDQVTLPGDDDNSESEGSNDQQGSNQQPPVVAPIIPDDTDDDWYYEEIEEDDDTESLVVRIKFDGVDEADFEEIKVNLLKNGKKYDSEELSASKVSKKDWRFEWDNLDEDDDWSVALAAELEGYDAEVVNLRGNYWTITLTSAEVEAPVVSVDKANPETGASDFVGAAVALAVVSSIGAVALNKRR